MGDITGTLDHGGEFGGNTRLVVVTAPVGSASDDIVLTKATHGISAITGIVSAVITGGHDAAFTFISASYSGLTITVVTKEADGSPSSAWGDTTVSVTVVGTY
jgi:hypothetical protein